MLLREELACQLHSLLWLCLPRSYRCKAKSHVLDVTVERYSRYTMYQRLMTMVRYSSEQASSLRVNDRASSTTSPMRWEAHLLWMNPIWVTSPGFRWLALTLLGKWCIATWSYHRFCWVHCLPSWCLTGWKHCEDQQKKKLFPIYFQSTNLRNNSNNLL